MSRFVIRPVPSGHKFDLRAPNGEVILSSGVYATPAACRRGIESVRKNALRAPVEDLTLPPEKPLSNPKFQLYQDRSGQFRFRLKARNGEIIAFSEGYRLRSSCENGIDSVRKNAPEAAVEADSEPPSSPLPQRPAPADR